MTGDRQPMTDDRFSHIACSQYLDFLYRHVICDVARVATGHRSSVVHYQLSVSSNSCMKKIYCTVCLLFAHHSVFCWGFYMHEKINYHAVFLLPPPMMLLFKQNIGFLTEHAVDPDKRRYIVSAEGARHYLDIDHYGHFPFKELPRDYNSALKKYSADTLQAFGIVPWWISRTHPNWVIISQMRMYLCMYVQITTDS